MPSPGNATTATGEAPEKVAGTFPGKVPATFSDAETAKAIARQTDPVKIVVRILFNDNRSVVMESVARSSVTASCRIPSTCHGVEFREDICTKTPSLTEPSASD